MALTRVTDNVDEIEAFQLNQYAALLEGDTGAGHPIAITALNDSTNYAVQIANQDLTNGRALRVLKANLTDPWLDITNAGVRVENLRMNHILTVSSPGSGLMAVWPETDDILYIRSGAAGAKRRVLDGAIGTAAGDIVRWTASNTPARLAVGTARQQLAVNSGATDLEYVASLQSLMTTQGDILQASAANTPARLGIGTIFQALGVNAAGNGLAYMESAKEILSGVGDLLYSSAGNTLARRALGATGYALLAGATAPIYEPISRKNRVTNGDMRVKQRTTLGSTDDSYTLDRHIVLMEAANACVVTQETSDVPTDGSKRAMKLTVGSGNNNKFGDFIPLEFADIADLRGKVVSIQLKLKSTAGLSDVRVALLEWTSTADVITSDVVSAWGAAGANPTLVANWAYCSGYTSVSLAPTTSWGIRKVEGQYTVGASANNLGLLVWCDDKTTTQTTDYFLLTDIQLEEGSVCTNFERRAYSEELARCLPWVRIIGANGNCVVNTATRILPSDAFEIPMRIAPTATLINNAFQILEVGVGFQTGSASTIVGSSLHARGFYLDIDGFSGLTTSPASEVRVVSADFALLSAEL